MTSLPETKAILPRYHSAWYMYTLFKASPGGWLMPSRCNGGNPGRTYLPRNWSSRPARAVCSSQYTVSADCSRVSPRSPRVLFRSNQQLSWTQPGGMFSLSSHLTRFSCMLPESGCFVNMVFRLCLIIQNPVFIYLFRTIYVIEENGKIGHRNYFPDSH
jgi:hypothetical protein